MQTRFVRLDKNCISRSNTIKHIFFKFVYMHLNFNFNPNVTIANIEALYNVVL